MNNLAEILIRLSAIQTLIRNGDFSHIDKYKIGQAIRWCNKELGVEE